MRRAPVVALAAAISLVPAVSAEAAFHARGSVQQVQVTGAKTGSKLILMRNGRRVAVKRAGTLGGAVFRNLKPGKGYTLSSRRMTVFPNRSKPPSRKLYKQKIPASGYGYLRTRDGTKLAIDVRVPAGSGPFPTVIEYAGYGYANPAGAQSGISPILTLLGYAVVGVNIRGTGCSGGAFDFFEPLQGLDGYDIVETVAAQPWVLNHRPGMVGISYPGIAQTFVAPTRPPHLAAIAALSVVADTYRSLADPGGIPNIGFPREWAQQRDDAAQPYGQGWEHGIVDEGGPNGAQCAENQLMRHQNASLVAEFDAHPFREPVAAADALSP